MESRMDKNGFLKPAPPNYVWPQCPEADRFVRDQIAGVLEGHAFARRLSERMHNETSTEFASWVDHVILPKKKVSLDTLAHLGFIKDNAAKTRAGSTMYWHPFADLPRILLVGKNSVGCAVMVDSINDFLLAHGLSLPIEGAPYSQY